MKKLLLLSLLAFMTTACMQAFPTFTNKTTYALTLTPTYQTSTGPHVGGSLQIAAGQNVDYQTSGTAYSIASITVIAPATAANQAPYALPLTNTVITDQTKTYSITSTQNAYHQQQLAISIP